MRRTTRRIVLALALIAVSLLAAEAALATFDPLGIWRYYGEMRDLRQHTWPHDTRHYVMEPGQHDMGGWSFRVDLPDYTRYTPSSSIEAECTIVALGDSVTFGWGVDDEETWPNLVAELSGCRVINAGVYGYDIWAVEAAYRAFPGADSYIYLLTYNDSLPGDAMQFSPLGGTGALRLYVFLLQAARESVGPTDVPASFWTAYDALAADPRVSIYGFADGGLAEQIAGAGRRIDLLAPYTSRISWADAHPDAASQRQIAEMIYQRQAARGSAQ